MLCVTHKLHVWRKTEDSMFYRKIRPQFWANIGPEGPPPVYHTFLKKSQKCVFHVVKNYFLGKVKRLDGSQNENKRMAKTSIGAGRNPPGAASDRVKFKEYCVKIFINKYV